MDLELAGKTVLITGGTDGLGLALATQLATEGAAVAVCGRDEERLRAAEAAVRGRRRRRAGAAGRRLADPADLEAFVEAAVARWGRIDGIVHNAGRASAGSIETIDDETWESDVQLKLMAAVRLTRLALPHAAGQPRRRPLHPGGVRQGARRRRASRARSPVPPAWHS